MLLSVLLQIVQTTGTDSAGAATQAMPMLSAPPQQEAISVLDLILKGGWIMIPIGICSLVAVYIIIERYLAIRKAGKGDENFMNNIRDFIHNGNIASAQSMCKNTNTPVARMIEKGVARIGKPLSDIEKAIENVGNVEVVKLESGMSALATCASAAPMLGFLGTVMGMVRAFYDMKVEWDRTHESISIGTLSGGMFEAMITTVAGLSVGIVALIAYNVLSGMIKKAIFKMESTSIEFLDLLHEPAKK